MEHLTFLKRKLACDIAVLHIASTCLPSACLITLYHLFFYANLSYAILFWSSANSTLLHNIEVLQKCAICIFCGANPRSHAQELAKQSKNFII